MKCVLCINRTKVLGILIGLFLFLVDGIHYESYNLPSIQFDDLVSIDKSISIEVVTKIVTIGIIEVNGIPNFSYTKNEALKNVAECLDNTIENKNEKIIMNDGSYRISMMASSKNNIRTSFNNICGENSERLRNTIDMITNALVRALDIAKRMSDEAYNQMIMKPNYKTFDDIIYNGEHLEHIHSYYGTNNIISNLSTIDVHTDSGLMIAMTSGLYNNEPNHGSGLYIQLPTGIFVHANVADDAVIIMFGEGAAQWLNPVLGKQIRSVPHSLVANLAQGTTRSWYGKMFLPPDDALIFNEIPYKEFRRKQVSQVQKGILPVACSDHRQLTASNCPDGTIHCWMQCMSTTNLTCGSSAVCWDTNTNKQMEGNKMCSPSKACKLQCPIVNNTIPKWDGYCYGSGITMMMNGMTSIILSERGETACTNLIFEGATLNSNVKYFGGCIIVLAFCIFSQFLASYRLKLSTESNGSRLNYLKKVFFYFIQMNIGYLIMLVSMTYSVELFLMVTIGLTIGYAIFNVQEPALVTNGAECCSEMTEIDPQYSRVNSNIDLEKERVLEVH